MNVVIFGNRVIYGGGEKMYNWVTSVLLSYGHKVIFTTNLKDEDYLTKLKSVNLLGKVDVAEYPYHKKYSAPIEYCKYWKCLFLNNKVDLLLIFGGSLVEQLVARSVGVKVVLSERWHPNSRPFLKRVLKHIQYHYSDGYVFQTKEAGLCYGEKILSKSVIIPNPIIDDLPVSVTVNRKEIVCVGRLSPEKNQKILLEAFAKFRLIYPDYTLTIYGSGPLKEELLKHAEMLGIYSCFKLIEGKRNIPELINGASLFVLPSEVEGMPNALIEAMAMGLLCISTDCPAYGPRHIIDNGINGFLVPVNDPDALFSSMVNAISCSNAAEISQRAILIREKLNPEILGGQWIDYLSNVCEH